MANEIKEIVSNGTTYPILDNNAVHTSDIATSWTSPTTNTVPNTKLVDDRLKVDESNILSVQDMVCDDAFSTSKSYAVGDITIYDNKLYKFKNAHQGAWSASDVDQISLSEQNSDLTHLEAEDRTALIEEIDSGAKNKFNPSGVSALTNMSQNNYTFTATETDTRTVFYMRAIPYNGSTSLGSILFEDMVNTNGTHSYEFTKTASFNSIKFGHTGASKDLYIQFDVSQLTNGVTYVFQFKATQYNPANILTYTDVMICTKATFGVSPAFVPYRPNYDLVAQTVAHDIVFKKKSETITTANTWQVFSGLAVTLPVGKTIDIMASAEWSHNSPASDIAIIKGTTVTGTAIIATNEAPTGGQLSLCAHGMYYNGTNSDCTINVAVKYPSSENNQVSIAYRIF